MAAHSESEGSQVLEAWADEARIGNRAMAWAAEILIICINWECAHNIGIISELPRQCRTGHEQPMDDYSQGLHMSSYNLFILAPTSFLFRHESMDLETPPPETRSPAHRRHTPTRPLGS